MAEVEDSSQVFKTSAPPIANPVVFGISSSSSSFGLKLSIKLQDNNYLLWNQQVKGVILSHKIHRHVVNLTIRHMLKTYEDHRQHLVSSEYEVWMMQNQALFTLLLSTISETGLPRMLSCKCSHEVWDKVYMHFNAIMKARVRQLCIELKNSKKLNKSSFKFVLRIKAIVDSLFAVGDYISEQDQIDVILGGLPKEYNSFVMLVYGQPEPPTIYVSYLEK